MEDEEDGTGGGVGAYLCSLRPPAPEDAGTNAANVGDDAASSPTTSTEFAPSSTIVASLKAPRAMHGSPTLLRRWKHVGLVAGGTGVAPLFQIATMLLAEGPSGYTTDIHLLFVNRVEEDILLRDQLEEMVDRSGGRFRVTYSLTNNAKEDDESTTNGGDGSTHHGGGGKGNSSTGFDHRPTLEQGRGSPSMVQKSLPPPTGGDGTTMILVCGTDGFVDWWAGPVGRAPPKADGAKGPKIQGPLLGLLRDAGYDESEVFKY